MSNIVSFYFINLLGGVKVDITIPGNSTYSIPLSNQHSLFTIIDRYYGYHCSFLLMYYYGNDFRVLELKQFEAHFVGAVVGTNIVITNQDSVARNLTYRLL